MSRDENLTVLLFRQFCKGLYEHFLVDGVLRCLGFLDCINDSRNFHVLFLLFRRSPEKIEKNQPPDTTPALVNRNLIITGQSECEQLLPFWFSLEMW